MDTSAIKGKTFGSVLVALNRFFGQKPGQTLAEFSQECKALTDTDKAWFQAEFVKMGATFGAS